VRLIGVGNRLRGDDAAGLLVAEHVREAAPAGIEVVSAPRDAAVLLDAFDGAETVVIVDAVAGVAPGMIVCYDARAEPLPADQDPSSHGLGVAAAIELARALGRLPPRLIVYGIGGSSFGVGLQPCNEVVRAAQQAASDIVRSLVDSRAQ
jgi:hydrogenase maturation protease